MADSSTSSRTPRGAERRKHPRTRAEWPATISLEDGYHEARLRDISASGVCFHIDRAIPEMSVLAIQLELPAGEGRPEGLRLRGEGVVVRCQRVGPAVDHYEVALFFHQLGEEERRALEACVAG